MLTELSLDRIAPTFRPHENAIGYQTWTNLLFVHWRVPEEEVRPLIPPELTLDTWEGDAWVGLVAFYMSGVRPWWSPPVPGVSNFCETNLRTYVHYRGRDPGVWFISLEAAQSLAVKVARRRWHLPYFRAEMSLRRHAHYVKYSSRRLWPGSPGAHTTIQAEVGPLLGEGELTRPLPAGQSLPGTLEHFLIERYLLYSTDPAGRLYRGQVYHTPYPVRSTNLLHLDESLLGAAGIRRDGAPAHAAFSDGVTVDIFPLRPI